MVATGLFNRSRLLLEETGTRTRVGKRKKPSMSTDTTTRRARYVALTGTAFLVGLAEAEIRHHVANQSLDYWNWAADWSN